MASAKGKWVDELPIALWAYRITPKQPTGETPYYLAFKAEALIPVEFGLDILHTCDSTELSHALDEFEEMRDRAVVRMVEYHLRTSRQREKKSSNLELLGRSDLISMKESLSLIRRSLRIH